MQVQRTAQTSQAGRACLRSNGTGLTPVAGAFSKVYLLVPCTTACEHKARITTSLCWTTHQLQAVSRQRSYTVSSYSKDATNGITKRGSGPALRNKGTQQGSLRAAIKQQKVPSGELAVIDLFNLLATPLS